MKLKMDSGNSKSKPQTLAPSSTSTSPPTSGTAQAPQHQNGAGANVQQNGSKFRSKAFTTPSTSSFPMPSLVNVSPPLRYGNPLPLRILVLKDLVGAIIGRGGGTIKQITQETHARVDVHRKESSTANENVIMIYGNADNCSQACNRILDVMQQEAKSLNRPDEISLKILASNNLIGRIIGKGGNTIKRIMQQTDTKIAVSSTNLVSQHLNPERTISISGTLENMCRAEVLISQKLRQFHENDIIQYQQSLMYSGLPSSIPPGIQAHSQPGPSNLPPMFSPGHHSQSQTSLPYTHGTSSSSLQQSGRPGSQLTTSASSSGIHGGSQIHHFQQGPPAPYYGPYMPYMYSHGPTVTVPGNIPGAYSGGPASPYLNIGNYPPMMQTIDNNKETAYVFIPNTVVGAIIGRGGSTIREMMNNSGASIKVAQLSDDESGLAASPSATSTASSDSNKPIERKVTLIGTVNAQYLAQYFVFQKVYSELCNQATLSGSSAIPPTGMYGDPTILKVEIFVPTQQVRRIIGKSGSVIQELQRNTGATIKLSKETQSSVSPSLTSSSSANGSTSTTVESEKSGSSVSASIENDLTSVHIIGDFQASFAAQRHIRMIVLRSSTNVPSPSSHSQQLQTQPKQQSPIKLGTGTKSSTITTSKSSDIEPVTSDSVDLSAMAVLTISSPDATTSNTALSLPSNIDNNNKLQKSATDKS